MPYLWRVHLVHNLEIILWNASRSYQILVSSTSTKSDYFQTDPAPKALELDFDKCNKLKPTFPSDYSGEWVYYLPPCLSWVEGVKLRRLHTCRHPKRNHQIKSNQLGQSRGANFQSTSNKTMSLQPLCDNLYRPKYIPHQGLYHTPLVLVDQRTQIRKPGPLRTFLRKCH